MFTKGVGDVIAELGRLRLRDTNLIPPDRCQPGTGAEVERRKCMCRWVLANVHSSQIELAQSIRSLNWKIYARYDIREAITKLVQQLRSNRISV